MKMHGFFGNGVLLIWFLLSRLSSRGRQREPVERERERQTDRQRQRQRQRQRWRERERDFVLGAFAFNCFVKKQEVGVSTLGKEAGWGVCVGEEGGGLWAYVGARKGVSLSSYRFHFFWPIVLSKKCLYFLMSACFVLLSEEGCRGSRGKGRERERQREECNSMTRPIKTKALTSTERAMRLAAVLFLVRGTANSTPRD